MNMKNIYLSKVSVETNSKEMSLFVVRLKKYYQYQEVWGFNVKDRIFKGTISKLREFPWSALLRYNYCKF